DLSTSTTPRQRIALMRAAATADPGTRASIEEAFDYDAVDTCAADSLCALACPVSIDTGAVMKGFRAERHGRLTQRAGSVVAAGWGPVAVGLRVGLRIAGVGASAVLSGATGALRKVVAPEWLPPVGTDVPAPAERRSALFADHDGAAHPGLSGSP